MLNMIVQLAFIGLAMGMIYSLMAMGLVLLNRAVGVMNFAQGDLLMLGAYITYALTYQVGLPMGPTLFTAVLCFAIFAIVFMFTVYWPVRNSSWPAAVVICTIGASIALKEAVTLIWGRLALVADPMISGSLRVNEVRIAYDYLIIIVVSFLVIFGVFVLFDKLYFGKLMQAAAQDKYMATIIGIPTVMTIGATYIIVMTIAGLGGYLVAPQFLVSTSLATLQLRAFAGTVIGGYGNLKGAVVGSILIGMLESFATFFTTTYKDAVVFLILLIVLVVRPQGIFGERILDKA